MKVAHHGSAGSSSERFLEAVSPVYAVISVGPDNSQLPREETLRRLEEVGAAIYRTDTDLSLIHIYSLSHTPKQNWDRYGMLER